MKEVRKDPAVDFSENYMEKLFYFCLRKTGSSDGAADLTQEIALCILGELRRGVIPEKFSAWVWQIARNRYARWADAKHKRAERESCSDSVEEMLADDRSVEEEYLHKEDLSLLRRELAFITSEYRDIVVAYYIDDRSVGDIAASLCLPVGTVKSKLFRARNILKEGMNMAREFGTLSYKPEDIYIIMSGQHGHYSEPDNYFRHALYKNIMLAAYRTPSTAEELAVELGVALPYMEDELKLLEEATLIRKNGNKYETNFFIQSAAGQGAIYDHLSDIMPDLTEAIIKAVEFRTACLEANGIKWHSGYQSYEDMKWTLLMMLCDELHNEVLAKEQGDFKQGAEGRGFARPNGGDWDLIAKERYTKPAPAFIGLNISHADSEASFFQYKFQFGRIALQTPSGLDVLSCETLASVLEGDTEGLFEKQLEKLVDCGYLRKAKSGYQPTFAVLQGDLSRRWLEGKLTEEQMSEYEKLCRVALDLIGQYYAFCRRQVLQEMPAFLTEDSYAIAYACSIAFITRDAVFSHALYTGYLTYGHGATEAKDRALGAYMIKK